MNRAGTSFRELLEQRELLVIPGGYSPLMARMAEAVGFASFFMAGSQTAAYLLGSPNVGLITMREMVDAARRIVTACAIPVIADGDEGYGNALNAYRAALEFAGAGTAAITIEDRRNATDLKSHAGPRIALDESLGKLRAAVAARDFAGSDMIIVARSDVMDGTRAAFDDAVDRCLVYKEEGGVDAIFINAVPTRELIEESCRRIPGSSLCSRSSRKLVPAPFMTRLPRRRSRTTPPRLLAARPRRWPRANAVPAFRGDPQTSRKLR